MEGLVDNSVVVFRNHIYRLLGKYETVCFFHDYYGSIGYFNDVADMRYYQDAIITIHVDYKKLTSSLPKFQELTYDDFMRELEIIRGQGGVVAEPTPEEVGMQLIECINRIRASKVALNGPIEIIEIHERHHQENLQKEIKKFVCTLPQRILGALEAANKPMQQVSTTFDVDEATLSGGYKILYQFPNADGVRRTTYKEYLTYIIHKLFPMYAEYKDSRRSGADAKWLLHAVYYLLIEAYHPFLRFETKGDDIIVQLPTQN